MIWDILLSATIEAGMGLLTEAGFGDAVKDFRQKLLKTDQKKRQAALQDAIDRAVEASKDTDLRLLLVHHPFQEEVARALLDPQQGFCVEVVADQWGEMFPDHVVALRRFFNTLQNILMDDPLWGPVLERYQKLRFRQDVRQALEEKNLPIDNAPILQAVSRAVDNYRASVRGGGAVAQGSGAKAVGVGGVLVERDYIQAISQVVIQNFIVSSTAESRSGDLRQRYLELTANQANLIPWTNMNLEQADPGRGEGVQLADIYIDLDTAEMRHVKREEELRAFLARQRDTERVSAQEVVNRHKKVLIMGDPGSGKSTFIKHLAYLMAQAALANHPEPWLDRLSQWDHGVLLPVRIELRQAAAGPAGQGGSAKIILALLRREMEEWSIPGFSDTLCAAIQEKKDKVLFLLDGLDEVPTDRRQAVVDAVNDLSALHPNHHYVVTCRPYAYVGQPWKLVGFDEVTLAPFSEKQIDRFIANWYEQLASLGRIERTAGQEKARRLKEAVRRRDLKELAERPLLLTVMAQLHAYAGHLPEDRTQLYADAVQLLLQRWESRLRGESGILEHLDIPGLKMSDLEAGLYEVALQAHRVSPSLEGTADISEGQLREVLCRYLNNDWNKAGLFVGYIRERAGLLIHHKTEAYTFPHLSFQEFLAACAWLGMENFPGESARLVREDWDRWREVFLLAAGYAARTRRLAQAIASVNFLLPRGFGEVSQPDDHHWRSAVLAGQALLEIGLVGVRRESAGLALFERVQTWLVRAIGRDDLLEPKRRVEAGSVLGKLGDPRLDVLKVEHMQFCRVPSGEFLMGEKKPEKTKLPEFFIARHEITNAQYAQFVAAGGYGKKELWEEAQKGGFWKEKQFKGRYDNEPRAAPVDYGEPFNLPNHPVVGISWYEALAFARWMNEQVQMVGKIHVYRESEPWEVAKGFVVTLPDEAEWEKAARGTDGRQYPWGDEFDPNKANTEKSGIGTTSAAGCFPGGESPYEALDMSGNVWEWVRGERSTRGGAFDFNRLCARCSPRPERDPSFRAWDYGFRIVVSTERLAANTV